MTIASTIKSSRQDRRSVFNQPVPSITLSVILTIALKIFIQRAWPYLNSFWHDWSRTVIATLVVSFIGVFLFQFRKRFQAMYGVSEVVFALVVIWINSAKAQSEGDATSRAAVVGGAYLIVRGLTNFYEGKKKEVT